MHFVRHLYARAEQCFACIMSPVFMECEHKWYVKSILCQNLFDISPSLSNKAKGALCYIGRGEDIDMAFWWHYEASLISPYCVVTASNHTSSLACGAGLNGSIELMHQVYEGWLSIKIKQPQWRRIHEYNSWLSWFSLMMIWFSRSAK